MTSSSTVRVWADGPTRLLAVVTAVSVAGFGLGAGGHPVPFPLDWALVLISCGLCLQICRQPTLADWVSPAAQRFWRAAVAGLGVIAVAMLVRAVNAPVDSGVLESAAEVVHGLGAVLMLGALLRLPIARRTRSGRIGLWLDVTILMTAAAVFLLHYAPVPADNSLATAGLVVAGLLGVFMAAKVTLTGSDVLSRGAVQMMGVSAVFGGVGAAVSTLLAGRGDINAFLLNLPLAGFTISLAARRQLADDAVSRGTIGSRARPYSLLPYVAVAAVDALLVDVVARNRPDRLLVAVGAVLLTAIVAGRQLWAFGENLRLTAAVRGSEERFRLLVQNANDIIAISERDGTLRYMSPAVRRILGREPEDVMGTTLADHTHPDDLPALGRALAAIMERDGASMTMEVRCRHADGTWKWLEITSTNLSHEPGIRGRVSNVRDISETRTVQDRLSHEATHDALTGLANRVLFGRRVSEALTPGREPTSREQTGREQTSVVLIDLDDFKIVNDTLGHATGDALLVAVAERLRAGVRQQDTVARLGGDEFALLLPGLSADAVDRTLVRIAESLLVPVAAGDQLLSVRASFGVATSDGDVDSGELLRRADIAMYEAKAGAGGGHRHFRPGMEARGVERSRLIDALAAGIEQDQLTVYYQPVVRLSDHRVTGVEALVRWRHPAQGLLGPQAFIEVAEESGLIVPLGRWVLRHAARQAAAWGPDAGTISVNVSGVQLRTAGFADEVAAVLRETGLPAQRLIVEITETVAVGGGPTAQNLTAIRDLGARLSLDDFGTGSSTLTTVARLTVDQIKLDRSFVDSPVIAGAVLHLARGIGADTVAEGVETLDQAARLRALGFERAQGYLFGRPGPAADLRFPGSTAERTRS